MTNDEEVGYCKPPKAHQWKPGQSGNPSGKNGKMNKASTAKSLQDYLAEELLELITPSVDGKIQKMHIAKAIAKGFVRDLMTAKPRDKVLLLRELRSLGVLERLETIIYDAQDDPEPLVSEEERRILAIALEEIEGLADD